MNMKSLFKKIALGFLALGIVFQATAEPSEQGRFLPDDTEAIRARGDLIAAAKNEILAEYFTLWDDDTSIVGFALLLKKAREGVDIKIIADSLSTKIPPALFTKLQELSVDKDGVQKIQIKLFNPFKLYKFWQAFDRDHAKLLIVDGSSVVSGGRNIGSKYFKEVHFNEGQDIPRSFLDIDMLGIGDVAQEARDNFFEVWQGRLVEDAVYYNYEGNAKNIKCNSTDHVQKTTCLNRKGRLQKKLAFQEERLNKALADLEKSGTDQEVYSVEEDRNWVLDANEFFDIDFLSQGGVEFFKDKAGEMSNDLIKLASEAEESIDIFNPYLIPPEYTKKLLEALINREKPVKIRIITNSMAATDNYFVQIGYQKKNNLKRLTEIGIELYEYNGPETMHAKAAMIDNKTIIVGSFNMDVRSSRINREVALVAKGKKDSTIAQAFVKKFEAVKNNSLLVAKGGEPVNRDERDSRISTKQKVLLKLLGIIYPFIKGQL